jgi:3-dehydroquinate dehydratase
MAVNGPLINDLNSKVNTVVGIKKYQQIKKVMAEFDSMLQNEINQQPHKVDHKIK